MPSSNAIISPRCVTIGKYMVASKSTVRAAASVFGISKSTVYKDVAQRLITENEDLYEEVRKLLDENKAVRHLRGGEATKNKYLKKDVGRRS